MPFSVFLLFINVLQFTFGTSSVFYLTLQENVTLDSPYYLFVFTPRTVSSVIAVVLAADASNERADKFSLDIGTVFADAVPGQYTYAVYEQDNDANLDPANAGALLESGIMQYAPETPFRYTERAMPTNFIQPS